MEMIELKNPLKFLKDLFQIFKIVKDIYSINNMEIELQEELKVIRDQMILNNLQNSPSNIDSKQYLDELILKLV
jgi:hypothetical protein